VDGGVEGDWEGFDVVGDLDGDFDLRFGESRQLRSMRMTRIDFSASPIPSTH